MQMIVTAGAGFIGGLLAEEVANKETSRFEVCDVNSYGEITDIVEKPEDRPSNLVITNDGISHR